LTYIIALNGVVVSYPTDGSCKLNTVEIPGLDGVYEALQFHIHSSSEHTINGMFYGAELHIVHKLRDGERYAVVGILLNPGLNVDNPEFGMVLDGWKKARADTYEECGIEGRRKLQSIDTDMSAHVNAYDILSADATFYQYSGSLTTPPCSEVVDWNLSPENNLISVNQYKELIELEYSAVNPDTCEEFSIVNAYGSTSRPTQPLNGRKVRHICPTEMRGEGGGGGGSSGGGGSAKGGDKGKKSSEKGSKGGDKGGKGDSGKGSKGGSEKGGGKSTKTKKKEPKGDDKHHKIEKDDKEDKEKGKGSRRLRF
jgi:carbonic anhydrase